MKHDTIIESSSLHEDTSLSSVSKSGFYVEASPVSTTFALETKKEHGDREAVFLTGKLAKDEDAMTHESMPFNDQLLATKFFVPISSHVLIPRPRLTTILDTVLQHNLTLLSAPAGFGKTSLLSEWIQSRPVRNPLIAWVSLDPSDNDPIRFWTYVLTALDTCQPGICTQLLDFLHAQQAPPLQSILTAFVNASLMQTEPLLLILDDYHTITEEAVHASLLYFIEHLPSHVHVLLSTRVDPPLPLSRLRVRRQVLELRTNQLRCTLQEGVTFLEDVMGIKLSTKQMQEVTRRTEGWLAGLQLLGLSLQGTTEPTTMLNELHGSQRYILDYLTEEVLRRQPVDVQDFLLRTSILERLSASLCDALMEQVDSQEMLKYLEQSNLFVVSLDSERRWYRYHALFAEALRYRLERSQAPLVPILHCRASEWYAQREHYREAVLHALQARAWERAAELIEHVAITLSYKGSEPVPLLQWLQILPPEVVRPRPYLCLIYAQMLFLVAPPAHVAVQQQAGIWLQEAETTLTEALSIRKSAAVGLSSQELQSQEEMLGSILAVRALIISYHGDAYPAFSLCQQALTHLSEQNLAVRALVGVAKALAHIALGETVPAAQSALQAATLGQIGGSTWQAIDHKAVGASYIIYQGRLHEAWHICQEAIETALQMASKSSGLLPAIVSMAYGHQADVLREWNQLDAAQNLVLQGIELAEQAALLSALDLSYTILGRIHMARGELDGAATAFARVEQVDGQLHNPYVQTVYLCVDRVRLWLMQGEVERASSWADEILHKERQNSTLAREREDTAIVRVLLAQEKPGEALAFLTSLIEGATRQGRMHHVIELLLLQALAYHMHQQEQKALKALAQAVHLAEPEGYIRRFVDEGPHMFALLSTFRQQERKKGQTSYLDTLLAAFSLNEVTHEPGTTRLENQPTSNSKQAPQQSLLDPLSERELDVLYLLARGASNQEIAQELVVALNTVKHHMSNILSKLGVSNRTQAVIQARALGLLSDE